MVKNDNMLKVMLDTKEREKMFQARMEGYKEGYSKGYDKALEIAMDVKNLVGQTEELRPAIRFLNQSKSQLVDKIVEETGEVVEAYNDGESKERLAEEIADVQEACETLLAKLGYSQKERRNVRLAVIEKNLKRNYYMPPKGTYGD